MGESVEVGRLAWSLYNVDGNGALMMAARSRLHCPSFPGGVCAGLLDCWTALPAKLLAPLG
jgi:hypothetical protein